MPIREISVDAQWQAGLRAVSDVRPVFVKVQDPKFPNDRDRKIDSGEQRRDEDTGFPVWEIAVGFKAAPADKLDTIYIKVPHPVLAGRGEQAGRVRWPAGRVPHRWGPGRVAVQRRHHR